MTRPWLFLRASSVLFLLLSAAFFSVLLMSNTSWKSLLARSSTNGHGAMEHTVLIFLRRLVEGTDLMNLENTGFSYHAELHTQVCLSSKPVRVAGNGLRVHIPSSRTRFTREVRPYARKDDPTAMKEVTPVKILYGETDPPPPPCDLIHNVTAVIFSSGGFSWNTFHQMNEIVIPLFLTSRHFGSQVRFIVADYRWWFVEAYRKVLSGLSDYDVMDLSQDGRVHCFPGLVLGLRYHNFLALNTTQVPKGHSMPEFRRFLMDSHSLNTTTTVQDTMNHPKPNLMFITRNSTRRVRNEPDMVRLMEQVGFHVIVANETLMLSSEHFIEVVNSCSIMVGVHGGGLAHGFYLPDGAVMVQIVPIGMDWAAENYYGVPATTMGLRHIEYKVELKESSLSEKYGPDDPVITDPESVFAKGYQVAKGVYFVHQDLNIDLVRFKETLVKALQLVRPMN